MPAVVPQAVEAIHRNASRQAKLVDDLLDFGRIAGGRTALDLEPIDAHAFLRGIVESVIPLAASNQIEIQLSAIPEATVLGDVRRLEQVFVNLLGNSLKFTPAGGHISVSARIDGSESRGARGGRWNRDRSGFLTARLRSVPPGRRHEHAQSFRARSRPVHRQAARRCPQRIDPRGERREPARARRSS